MFINTLIKMLIFSFALMQIGFGAEQKVYWETIHQFNGVYPENIACIKDDCYMTTPSSDFFKFNLTTKVKTNLMNLPLSKRLTSGKLVISNNLIFYMARNQNKSNVELYQYSFSEKKWSLMAPVIYDHYYNTMLTAHDGKLYFLKAKNKAESEYYVISENKWYPIKSLSLPRGADCKNIIHSNKIYIYSGVARAEIDGISRVSVTAGVVEVYNLLSKQWTTLTPAINMNESSILAIRGDSALVLVHEGEAIYKLFTWNIKKNTGDELKVSAEQLKMNKNISIMHSFVKSNDDHIVLSQNKILKILY